jgi:ribosomal protein L11
MWAKVKTPAASYSIKQAAGITSGSQKPGHQTAATISFYCLISFIFN